MSKSLCLKLLQNKKIKVSYKSELQYSTEVEGKTFVDLIPLVVRIVQHVLGFQVQVKDALGVKHGFHSVANSNTLALHLPRKGGMTFYFLVFHK